MDLEGQTQVTGTDLPIGSGYTLAAFEDHAMQAACGSYLQTQYGADSAHQRQALGEQFSAINARQVDLPARAPSSAMLEKFRPINEPLRQLGGPGKGGFPGVQLSPDLASAELYIGKHVPGICEVSSQAVLTPPPPVLSRHWFSPIASPPTPS